MVARSDDARTLAGRYYSDPAIFARENDAIFSKLWVCVGRADDVREAGSYALRTVANESVILLRDREGELRAFLNVCRHRGARLCTEAEGKLHATIQCRYHAWTYGLDGRLLGAPNAKKDPSFDAACFGLRNVALTEWEGLVWLCLSDDAPPLSVQLGALHDRFAHYKVGTLARGARTTYEVHANWKVVVENFSECYHCAGIHPELAAQVPDYRQGRVTGQEGGAALLGPGMESLTVSGKTNRPPLAGLRNQDKRAYYGDVFKPNVFLNLHPDYVVAHVMTPIAVDKTRVDCDWLFDAKVAGAPGFDPSDAVDFWNKVNKQDWDVCELAQLGVVSRGYDGGGYYVQDERHIRRFNDWVLALLGDDAR
jgi:Rieske 2Fe-2S family protein